VDLSKRYLEWGRRNYELNGIGTAGHEFIFGDALNWMERFARKGRQFDNGDSGSADVFPG